MSATEHDVRALEHLAHRLREDTHGCAPWDRQGTHVIFQRELVGKNLQIVTELVLAHALDPDAKTPAAITRKFPPKPSRPRTRDDLPPRARDYCTVHRDNPPPPHCPACATEKYRANYDTEPAPIPTGLTGADIARAAAGMPLKHQETTP